MLSKSFRNFLHDESGAYALWSLIWFSLYVAMGGLAVDMTDAYRNQTMLQATADAAALAGVLSLPNQADAVVQTHVYSASNMDPTINGNGNVLKNADVILGNWSFATETFSTGGAEPDAVYVTTRRSNANNNALATNFLRIMNLWGVPGDVWNISTEAIAVKYIPECLIKNGLVAYNKVDVTSNNGFTDICVHGQNVTLDPGQNYAVDMGNNNTFDSTVQVSMPDLNDLNGKPNVCTNNPGLCDPGVLVEGDMLPKDVGNLGDILDGLTGPLSDIIPDYIDGAVGIDGLPVVDVNGDQVPEIVVVDENYLGPYEEGKIYDVNCSNDNKTLNLPTDVVIEEVAIIADCKIKGASGVTLNDAVLASSAIGNGSDPLSQHSINLASDAGIGTSDFCNDGSGQVHVYALASVHIAAGPTVYGLRTVAGGDFHFTANNDVRGISAEAGNNITATANGEFTFCGGTFGGPFAWHYRLVR